MDENTKQIIEGRKTFFIVPDTSLLPETYLEDFMDRGYEAYIINDDRQCPLDKKIEIIINTFPDSIFFFYIDSKIDGIDWPFYIRNLNSKYEGKLLIGVLYSKRRAEEEKTQLERYYLFDVGIPCGCISLEFQRQKNFLLIDKVMYANQAAGRRQNVRAICDGSSKVSFNTVAGPRDGIILDVSVSHFSCVFNIPPQIKLYEKVNSAMFNIAGTHFMNDAILFMTRPVNGRDLYVFVFSSSSGQNGLDPDKKDRLSKKIYSMITDKVKKLMQTKFEEARNKIQENSSPYKRTYSSADFQ